MTPLHPVSIHNKSNQVHMNKIVLVGDKLKVHDQVTNNFRSMPQDNQQGAMNGTLENG